MIENDRGTWLGEELRDESDVVGALSGGVLPRPATVATEALRIGVEDFCVFFCTAATLEDRGMALELVVREMDVVDRRGISRSSGLSAWEDDLGGAEGAST
jgi:hypothetical protein